MSGVYVICLVGFKMTPGLNESSFLRGIFIFINAQGAWLMSSSSKKRPARLTSPVTQPKPVKMGGSTQKKKKNWPISIFYATLISQQPTDERTKSLNAAWTTLRYGREWNRSARFELDEDNNTFLQFFSFSEFLFIICHSTYDEASELEMLCTLPWRGLGTSCDRWNPKMAEPLLLPCSSAPTVIRY